MIKKILKVAAGLLLGLVVVANVQESVDAEVVYVPKNGVIYGVDTSTGFFVELPAGIVIPAGSFGNCMNLVVSYDADGKYSLAPTASPIVTAESFVNYEYMRHQYAFQKEYGPLLYNPMCGIPCAPNFQVPNIQMPEIPVPAFNTQFMYNVAYNPYFWSMCK